MTLKRYHVLFIVFLIITIMLLILLVVLFFVFNIRKIINIKTGWTAKQNVEYRKGMRKFIVEKSDKKFYISKKISDLEYDCKENFDIVETKLIMYSEERIPMQESMADKQTIDFTVEN